MVTNTFLWQKAFANMVLGEKKKKAPAASLQPRDIVKNMKFGLKLVAVGAFGASPIPKCTIFRA